MKKVLSVLLIVTLIFATVALTACQSADYTIGVMQFANHDALNKATEGFKQRMNQWAEENGKTIRWDENNASGVQSNASTIASTLVAKNVDLIFANATPCAIAAANATESIPVLYTSVTNPEGEGLTTKDNVAGTSDLNPVAAQIQLMKDMVPDLDNIALLYCSNETNSKVQADLAKEKCEELGITATEITVAESNLIQSTLQTRLTADIDAVYIPTDNMMAENMGLIVNVTNEMQIPTIVGESGMVSSGGTATLSIDYFQLGVQTAEIAIAVLEGNEVAKHQFYNRESQFTINEEGALACGMTQSQIDAVKEKYAQQ